MIGKKPFISLTLPDTWDVLIRSRLILDFFHFYILSISWWVLPVLWNTISCWFPVAVKANSTLPPCLPYFFFHNSKLTYFPTALIPPLTAKAADNNKCRRTVFGIKKRTSEQQTVNPWPDQPVTQSLLCLHSESSTLVKQQLQCAVCIYTGCQKLITLLSQHSTGCMSNVNF